MACQEQDVHRSRNGTVSGLAGAIENVSPVPVISAPTGGISAGAEP
jgi:hypothetical protein